ncbi:hypothetical protein CCACVL1_05226 [Corchorus capsularis]|uniref:Uncharacterized protein n=1 Tax=Corchorus capsularis TaxID=210143 RepID=A0A1R3JLV7_COCAP|nr:hypothetical protein CCACVL1_05226 [Corchorus capsularis]
MAVGFKSDATGGDITGKHSPADTTMPHVHTS